jgi:hypothetical protein
MGAANPIHIGRSLIVVETAVRDTQNRLVAKISQSQMVLHACPHALAFYTAMGFEVVDTATMPLGSGLRMRLVCDADNEEG